MKHIIRAATVVAFTCIAQIATSSIAYAFDTFPVCGESRVLNKIIHRYNWAERNTWHDGVDLVSIVRVGERRLRAGDDATVERRFCRGHGRLSDGRHRTVHYLIERGAGFAGLGWNVEFCVSGNDPWRVYDGSCRVLRR